MIRMSSDNREVQRMCQSETRWVDGTGRVHRAALGSAGTANRTGRPCYIGLVMTQPSLRRGGWTWVDGSSAVWQSWDDERAWDLYVAALYYQQGLTSRVEYTWGNDTTAGPNAVIMPSGRWRNALDTMVSMQDAICSELVQTGSTVYRKVLNGTCGVPDCTEISSKSACVRAAQVRLAPIVAAARIV